jgi:hypothetical protein
VKLPASSIAAERVAVIQEFGTSVSFVADISVRAYLRALAQGVAGTGESVTARGGPLQITIRIPARPVWMPAFEAMTRSPFGPNGVVFIFAQELRRHTGLPINFSAG